MRMASIRCLALAGILLAAACNDDDAPVVTPVAQPDAAGGDVDGGVAPDAAPMAVPLTVWVNDLVQNFGPMSPPDTVDDKVITDTDDPAAFDTILQ
jgi:hypothetical protein